MATTTPHRRDMAAKGAAVKKLDTALRGGSATTAFRDSIFPIYGNNEVRKFILLSLTKFFIVFVLTLTRDSKDTLIVTSCGAEAIAFLKVYGVIPCAAGFIGLYGKMSKMMSKSALYYSTVAPFFLFFIAYDVLLLPNKNLLAPSASFVSSIFGESPVGARLILSKLLLDWTSALYYVMAELYSSVSIGILFWQRANDVVPIDEAKRFYPLFGQISSIAPIMAGLYVIRFASKAPDFSSSMHRLTAAITLSGVMICLLYAVTSIQVQGELMEKGKKSAKAAKATEAEEKKKKKEKMSTMESVRFLLGSEYLKLIATMVIGYGLSINFTEIMWKSLVKARYPSKLDYQRFMGNFSTIVGATTFLVIFVGSNVIKRLGYRIGVLATPVMMLFATAPFFAATIFSGESIVSDGKLLTFAVILGTIQSLLSKATKYALFDPTTQMAYIPLTETERVQGKAAIDVLGSRVGKSGGSLIQQVLVLIFGSILSAAPAVAVIFYTVIFLWIRSASRLSKLFLEKTEGDGGKSDRNNKKSD